MHTDRTLKVSYIRGKNIVKESPGDEDYYYLSDAVGYVRCLVDATWAITDSYRFDSYGMTLIEWGDTENPYYYILIFHNFFTIIRFSSVHIMNDS